jgi:thiol:disulfide interchange protein DsbD
MNTSPRSLFAWLLIVLATFFSIATHAESDLLEPDVAFQFSAKLVNANRVQVRYRIADGYYMYRDRFRVAGEPLSVKVGKPKFPAGEVKHDEFFGKVETYRDALVFDVPLASPIPADGFVLKVISQGCSDIGVCYTPLTQTAKLLPVAYDESGVPPKRKSTLLDRLEAKSAAATGETEQEFLPVDKAFTIEVRSPDAQTLVARLSPADTYYLYREKLHFALAATDNATVESVRIPRGEEKQDPNFGKTEVFHKPVTVTLRLKRSGTEPLALTLDVGFQGCSEKGLCYPPTIRQIAVKMPAVAASPLSAEKTATDAPAVDAVAAATPSSSTTLPLSAQSEDQQIAGLFKGGSFWLVVASFFGFGLLLSLTPCVLPMIPILSGMIAGQGTKVTKLRGFTLSAVYVLGMALAYAVAGVLAGLSGSLLSASLQNPWVLGAFAAVFVGLALSMFGFYELQLPSAWQSSAAGTSNRLTGGTLVGVFAMGAVSAVIVGPCVAAPLAGALIYISQSRDLFLGGSALFAMALGMGVPLLIVGASAGTLLPKVGAWMQSVKNFFGVLLIAAAIWIISPLLPVVALMLCASALLVVSGIFLRAIDPLPADASGYRRLGKGFGVIVLLAGVALLVGALSGNRNPLQPLSGFGSSANKLSSEGTQFVRVGSIVELDRAVAAAGKPVMLDFYADWCVSCKEMDRLTFQDAGVKKSLAGMLLLQADVTANSADDRALLKRFGLFGPPGIIFFDRRGNEIHGSRVVGYKPAERFSELLAQVSANY